MGEAASLTRSGSNPGWQPSTGEAKLELCPPLCRARLRSGGYGSSCPAAELSNKRKGKRRRERRGRETERERWSGGGRDKSGGRGSVRPEVLVGADFGCPGPILSGPSDLFRRAWQKSPVLLPKFCAGFFLLLLATQANNLSFTPINNKKIKF